MKHFIFTPLLLVLFLSCSQPVEKIKPTPVTIDPHWVDSIKQAADTFWIKPYGRNRDFISSAYYINRKDSTVAQFMKDSSGRIRQVIIAKYDQVRKFFAEYYANGQLMASRPLDSAGRYDGFARFYYPSGIVKSEGHYRHGFFSGTWKNYDSAGRYVSEDRYDENGQLSR
ncbi:MAG: hypothetical protein U0X40_09395 [Ferruginibacter sp.]